jgi:hypothetical protein
MDQEKTPKDEETIPKDEILMAILVISMVVSILVSHWMGWL